MTELTRELWESSEFLRRRRENPSAEPLELLEELADAAAIDRLGRLGVRDLMRLREVLLDAKWEPTSRTDAARGEGDAAVGAAALLAYWRGAPLLSGLGDEEPTSELDEVLDSVRASDPEAAPLIAAPRFSGPHDDDPVSQVERLLDDVRAADPEAVPLIAWELYAAIEPRLTPLRLDRVPLSPERAREHPDPDVVDAADRRFEEAEATVSAERFERRWHDLLDRIEGSPALTIPGLVDGRANIRNRFDAEEVIARHLETLTAVRAEGPDASAPLQLLVVELTPPAEEPPFGLQGAFPWRRAVPFPEGEDSRAGWIWASERIYDLDTLQDAIWAAVHDQADVVVFDPGADWTYGASGIDGLLISNDALLRRVATRLDLDDSYIEEAVEVDEG
ncbi:hypothetical protein [Salinibacterium sp. ZJ70]|uniref:hypothetical protein n=1 Tax=Salinibacterium sp. ZJ70 TaxID=2708084 RepID=UPI00141DFEB7|nr:hypothetical protein [Salinibacterium sp. ZJ70]